MGTTQLLDQNGLKTGQALTIILLVTAFILDAWPLVACVAIAQLAGALGLSIAPYRLFYRYVVLASGRVRPRLEPDDSRPHRFALLVGGVFNAVATVTLLAGLSTLGWVLVGVVVVLANLNFWAGFCLGCWMYYQLQRLGVPGFSSAADNTL